MTVTQFKENIIKTAIKFAALTAIVFSSLIACDPTDTEADSWTIVTNSTFGSNTVNAVTYGNDVFVAVGRGGRIARSVDGKNWTAVDTNVFSTGSINAIAFGNGMFMAGGEAGRMAFSTDDGLTWTAVTTSTFSTNAINGIAFGSNRWVAVGEFRMAYSTNAEGTTWTGQSSNVPFGFGQGAPVLMGVVFGTNRFVLVGAGGGQAHDGSLADSSDGITWTSRNVGELGLASTLTSVCFGNGKFVATADSIILYSTTGTTWFVADEIPFGNLFQGITTGDGKFVAVGSRGLNMQSDDGIKWAKFLEAPDRHFRDVAYGNGTWVAVGLDGTIAYYVETK